MVQPPAGYHSCPRRICLCCLLAPNVPLLVHWVGVAIPAAAKGSALALCVYVRVRVFYAFLIYIDTGRLNVRMLVSLIVL